MYYSLKLVHINSCSLVNKIDQLRENILLISDIGIYICVIMYFYIVLIYRPPSGRYQIAQEVITTVVSELNVLTDRHSIIVCGDFNINFAPQKSQT